MRWAFLLACLLALAGCTTPGDGGDGGATTTPPTTPDASALPAPIEDSKTVQGSADPLAGTPIGPPCSSPLAQCFRYPFELNASATLDAKLTWTVQANDFDLHVFQDGQPTEFASTTPPPGTQEALSVELEPGAYELVVSAYGVTQDTYKLIATFA